MGRGLEGGVDIMPDVLVTGGGGSLDGLAAALMRMLGGRNGIAPAAATPAPASIANG